MAFFHSRLYQAAEKMVNLLLLNFLWVLASLPIITIFPSTIAMFGVLRDWHMQKNEGVWKPFIRHFVKNFKISLVMTVIWVPLAYILVTNLQILNILHSVTSVIMAFVIGLLVFILIYTTMYLFPVMVHFDLPIIQLIKNAFFIASSQWKSTSIGLVILLMSGFFLYQFPALIIFATSIISYLIYQNCYSAFKNIGASY
ncbi:DUF624 domain-containing protein [Gracilibacillus sp. YIM 98692]|uniref:YesL family protein n=1 Tax=Gracilibacillus sp. YIM 98692 TaxID=2663532 RepID=UPI0013D06753|nr:DUF624 domain-containing protein [Gracilibacillus sp. YIM 98692]